MLCVIVCQMRPMPENILSHSFKIFIAKPIGCKYIRRFRNFLKRKKNTLELLVKGGYKCLPIFKHYVAAGVFDGLMCLAARPCVFTLKIYNNAGSHSSHNSFAMKTLLRLKADFFCSFRRRFDKNLVTNHKLTRIFILRFYHSFFPIFLSFLFDYKNVS